MVAGGGGAFFHPSHTTINEVTPEMVYPPAKRSRDKVADELFKFWNIWKGGYVWLFGAIIALVVFFAASFPFSSRDVVDTFPYFVKAGISTGLDESTRYDFGQIPRTPFWADPKPMPDGASGGGLMSVARPAASRSPTPPKCSRRSTTPIGRQRRRSRPW